MTIPFCSCSCVASVVISLVVVAMSSYSASTGNLGICVAWTLRGGNKFQLSLRRCSWDCFLNFPAFLPANRNTFMEPAAGSTSHVKLMNTDSQSPPTSLFSLSYHYHGMAEQFLISTKMHFRWWTRLDPRQSRSCPSTSSLSQLPGF